MTTVETNYHQTSTEVSKHGTETTHLAVIIGGEVVTITVCHWPAVPYVPAATRYTASDMPVYPTLHELVFALEVRHATAS